MTIYANNVAGTLAANIGPSDTAVLLGAGQGAAFPSPGVGEYFYATLQHFTTGVVEIVKCTARSSDTLTVERGRDGTTATSFTTGSVVEMRLVGIMLSEIDFRPHRGAVNGLASLDATTRVPVAQMPTSVPIMDGSNKILITNIPDAVATDAELALKANLSGATFSGNISAPIVTAQPGGAGGVAITVGNDATINDVNVAHTLGVISSTDVTKGFVRFGTGGDFGWNGSVLQWAGATVWHSSNFNPAAYLPLTGGVLTGDLTVYRSPSPNTGVVFLNQSQNRYLHYNGSAYVLNAANLEVGGNVYGTDFIISSDRRLKKGIKQQAIRPHLADNIRIHEWVLRGSEARGRGEIAQRVLRYAPEYVDQTGDYLGIDKAGLALESVAGLSQRVRKLERQVVKLTEQLRKLKKSG